MNSCLKGLDRFRNEPSQNLTTAVFHGRERTDRPVGIAPGDRT